MAMNAGVLGAAIKTALDGVSDVTDRDEVFTALAQAIITHITTATVTVTVTSVSGVTPGGGDSGAGTGTATIA